MDVSLTVRQRLKELGLDQKDLAAAVEVTESYISQLLTRKKAPPAPGRTDLYEKIGRFLGFPKGELSTLADLQRAEESKKRAADPPSPLFKASRDLILRKCEPPTRAAIAAIFQRHPFGELERLVTQKLLDVAQGTSREELRSENWLRSVAQLNGRRYEEMRVGILDFLDTDVFNISAENCATFLDPIIESWDIDLKSFGLEILLNERLAPRRMKRFDFVESEPEERPAINAGLEEFLKDSTLSGNVTEEEIEFLRSLKLNGRQPSPLYYYRELQNLRDPLHFAPATAFSK